MLLTALIALLIDSAIGWPKVLFSRIGHPVTWLGALIDQLESRLNKGTHRVALGTLASLLVIGCATLPAIALAQLGPIWACVLAWPLVAARSLHDHVAAVAKPLIRNDLAAARAATAMIVGRDISGADEAALARASLESLAENTSDGVIAPLFWAVIAGLPGIVAYKAINTLDSMIGHRNPRYAKFGRFAARLDDVVNWVPARLTALLFAIAAASTAAIRITWRDANQHRSPNAGWPEAAMAGALGVRLSGPRQYADRFADEPWLNGTCRDPGADDLMHGLRLYRRALVLLAVLMSATFVL